MGNFNQQLEWAREAPARDEAERRRRADLDARFPPMERPCGTPGAVYSVIVEGNKLGCVVEMPFEIAAALPPEAAERMKAALHDAVLPLVERFYRDIWDQTLAGKVIDDDPEPLPKRWELLFSKWLQRCFNRGEWPKVEGQARHSKYALPDAYRWWVR